MGVYICNIQKRSNWIRLCRTRGVVTISVAVGDDRFNTMAFTYSDISIEDSLRPWVSDASIQAELPNEKKYSHTDEIQKYEIISRCFRETATPKWLWTGHEQWFNVGSSRCRLVKSE